MKVVQLKRLARVEAGQSPPSEEVRDYDGEGLPFLQGNAEFGPESPEPQHRCDSAPRQIPAGDVLLSVRAPVGALNIADRAYGIGRGLAAIRPIGGRIHPRFLWWLLHSLVPILQSVATGSTYDAISAGDIGALAIKELPLDQQEMIAEFLDRETARIDGLIAAKKRMIDLLEQLWQTIMAEGVCGRLTGRHEYQASSIPWLSQIPVGWREGKLNLVARLGSGHTPSRKVPEWWENPSMPWITTGEVEQFRNDRIEYVNDTREMISELGISNSSATLHPAGTVVLCRTASAGYSAIMGRDMATSQDFATWTCGPLIRPRFLLLCLRVMRQDLLGRLAMGSTHQTIYMPEIESIKVPLPPAAEQDAIVSGVQGRLPPIDQSILDLDRQVRLLNERRQTIIAAAIAGVLQLSKEAVA